MIRVTVMYPNTPDSNFDWMYSHTSPPGAFYPWSATASARRGRLPLLMRLRLLLVPGGVTRVGATMRRIPVLAALVLLPSGTAAQTPAQSFVDLQPRLAPGQQVIVHSSDGRRVQAEVVSLTGSQIEILRRRFLRRAERQTLPESSVHRIERRDSTANGAWIGFGIGVLMWAGYCKTIKSADEDCLWGIFAPTLGMAIGEEIDGRRNEAVYVSPAAPRVTLLPLLGLERAALAVTLRF